MFVYIVIYIVIGVIAGIIDDESEKKKNLSFTLMIIAAIISFLTNGIFVIAAIIEMAIGYLIIVKMKGFFNKNKKNSYFLIGLNENSLKLSEANHALDRAIKDLKEKEKERLVDWAIQFNISEIVYNQENIENIEKLDISNKNIEFLPYEIICLENLKILKCNNNNITKLPIEIFRDNNLMELELLNNKLEFLPLEIGSMKNLSILLLSGNDLKSLPESIINLKSLKKLQLVDNKLLKINANQRLWILDLIHNKTDVEIDNQLLVDEKDKDINVRDILKKAIDDVKLKQSIVTESDIKEIKEEKTKNIQNPPHKKRGLRIVKKASSEKNFEKDITEFIDKEFENLKIELQTLENKLQTLSEQKIEYLNDIEEFNTLYNLHLGELLKDILNLKKEILYKQTIKQQEKRKIYEDDIEVFNSTKENIEEIKQTIEEFEKVLEDIDEDNENYDEIFATYKELQEELGKLEKEIEEQEESLSKIKEELEVDEIFREYEEVKKQYEQFHQNYEDIKQQQSDVFDITNEQKSELKKLWKKACKLCHPDIVIDKFKEKAHEIMQALNDAYSKKDIVKVQEILSNLENGLTFEIESDNINDKELLKEKIKQYKKNILELENEIEDLKHDETYQTIQEIDDVDLYFEELKFELQSEKDRLEKEAKGILQRSDDEIPEWIQRLWDWADENNISSGKLSRKIENLINTSTIDFTNLILENIPSEIINLKKLTTLVLWDCNLKYLPKDIIKLNGLKKLNIRGNLNLSLTQSQKNWIDELRKKATVFSDDNYTIVIDSTLDFVENSNIDDIKQTNNEVKKTTIIEPEITEYSKYIQSIENINFEKIRRYCNNLLDDKKADELQKFLTENGKMYKAIVYDALEQFISKLDKQTITLVDWGCNQGIGSMLVLDYIKEKQLNIIVNQIILVDDNTTAISRAMSQIKALKQNDLELLTIQNDTQLETLKNIKNDNTLNILINDKMPINILFDLDCYLLKNAYFICLSNENESFVNDIHGDMQLFNNIEDISIRDNKIGRFKRYERIFEINNLEQNISEFDIDDDEIPSSTSTKDSKNS